MLMHGQVFGSHLCKKGSIYVLCNLLIKDNTVQDQAIWTHIVLSLVPRPSAREKKTCEVKVAEGLVKLIM